MLAAANLVVLNKVDLLPYVDFPVDDFICNLRRVNPAARLVPLSATSSDGLGDWYRWLDTHIVGAKADPTAPA